MIPEIMPSGFILQIFMLFSFCNQRTTFFAGHGPFFVSGALDGAGWIETRYISVIENYPSPLFWEYS
jgi:hypothetical protein